MINEDKLPSASPLDTRRLREDVFAPPQSYFTDFSTRLHNRINGASVLNNADYKREIFAEPEGYFDFFWARLRRRLASRVLEEPSYLWTRRAGWAFAAVCGGLIAGGYWRAPDARWAPPPSRHEIFIALQTDAPAYDLDILYEYTPVEKIGNVAVAAPNPARFQTTEENFPSEMTTTDSVAWKRVLIEETNDDVLFDEL